LASLAIDRDIAWLDATAPQLGDQQIMLLIAADNPPVSKLVREAYRRAERLRTQSPNREPILVLCVGNAGRLPEQSPDVMNLISNPNAHDQIDGPLAVQLQFCDAHQRLVEVS
jgi:hypothetical protein